MGGHQNLILDLGDGGVMRHTECQSGAAEGVDIDGKHLPTAMWRSRSPSAHPAAMMSNGGGGNVEQNQLKVMSRGVTSFILIVLVILNYPKPSILL